MNKQHIIDVAGQLFAEFQHIKDDLYKGELKINSARPAGIFYLDLSGDVSPDNFSQYQERIFANEYYNNPGSLQWNYYLLLLQDQIDKKSRSLIEKNDKYARKYVFTENEFENFFKLDSSRSTLQRNIVLDWKAKLDSVDLQEVYSKEHYTEAIDRFYNNSTKKIQATSKAQTATSTEVIKNIRQIRLTSSYRKYPIYPRDYEFGKVNLIKGINGTGKTCLFEAIETAICGRTYRNPDKREADGCVEVLFNDSVRLEKCNPSNNELFRQRDLLWFSNDYPRDNNLHASFNRFNYFNADAAYTFSTTTNEEDVKNALFNIVLGSEFNHILERAGGFHDRLRPLYNQITNRLNTARETLKASDKIISESSDSLTLQGLKSAIEQNVSDLKILNNKIDFENIGSLETNINLALTLIQSILNSNKASKSRGEILGQIQLLNTKEEKLKEFRKIITSRIEQVSTIELLEEDYNNKLDVLNESLKYFNDPKLFRIDGLNARIQNTNSILKKIEYANNILAGLNLANLKVEKSLATLNQENNDQLLKLTSQQLEIESKINKELEQLNNVEKILKQIKFLGKEYVEAQPTTENCPLCDTHFESSELRDRINRLLAQSDNSTSENIIQLKNDLSIVNSEIKKIINYLQELNQIKLSFGAISTDEPSVLPLREIISLLEAQQNEQKLQQEILDELVQIREIALSLSITEASFRSLQNRFSEEFNGTILLDDQYKNKVEELIAKINLDLSEQASVVKKINDEIHKITNEIVLELGFPLAEGYNLTQLENLFEKEKAENNSIASFYERLSAIILLDNNTNLHDAQINFLTLVKNIESFKIEIKNQFILGQAQKNRKEAEATINQLEPEFARHHLAFQSLKTLLADRGDEHLSVFFNEHLSEIVDIFKTIHAPREFANIVYENKQLIIITDTQEKRRITQISTGQRSALALAIFISMNRKLKNGPHIIMFDDPVSFIDDLNALAFLDFLRLFVLKEGKQIFFATANNRLANLFEKKFDFLDNDFKKWELKRAMPA